MSIPSYDFIVIGGGSAGYAAARTAHDAGLKVAVVDCAAKLGGLCILRGCMPSKTLLYTAEMLHHARHAERFGLVVTGVKPDMKAVAARKRRIIAEFAEYRAGQLESGRFDLYRARATFADAHTLALSDGRTITGKKFIIATGSKVATPAIPGLAEAKAWTSDEVLDLDFLPESVIVLGGGIVACELAQYLARMGSKVTVIQRSEQLLRDFSPEAGATVVRAFRDEGMTVHTGTAITGIRRSDTGFTVDFTSGAETKSVSAAHLFNALGREPALDGLGLAAAGVKLRKDGRIRADRWGRTSAKHIYAAGDCSGPVEIVHVAIAQGELAARHAAGMAKLKPVDFDGLIGVVFTDPQVATIGLGARVLTERGIDFLAADYPFDDHGKSILMEAKHGFVRVFAEPKRGRILGAEIVGKDAGELIHCFSVALIKRATCAEMLAAQWYHPTLAEILSYPLEEIADKVKAAR